MRLPSSIVFVTGVVVTVLACSSKDESAPAIDGGSSSSSGASSSGSTDSDAATSSSSGSSGTTDAEADADAAPAKVWVTTTNETMMLDGAQRQYFLSVPLNFDATKKYPLYILMHGNPGTSQQVAGLVDAVTHDEAIIAYPSSKVTDGWDLTAAEQDNADTAFLLALVDELAATKSVDKTKVILSGYSGGGFMSSAMGCRYYASFKMIGIHAGGAPFNETGNPPCDGAQIPTVVTHGALDNNVGPTSGYYAAEYWRNHNGCDSTTTATTPSPCVKYDNCAAGEPVTYCLRPNEGHELWSRAIEVDWAFFKALP